MILTHSVCRKVKGGVTKETNVFSLPTAPTTFMFNEGIVW